MAVNFLLALVPVAADRLGLPGLVAGKTCFVSRTHPAGRDLRGATAKFNRPVKDAQLSAMKCVCARRR
ncbi:MAG: hypothetical protein ABSG53_10145 [Thermoguttaceae bacterium]